MNRDDPKRSLEIAPTRAPAAPAPEGKTSIRVISPRRVRAVLDADPVRKRLWQSAHPPAGPDLARLGFTMAVFCAVPFQPEPESYPGLEVVLAPNLDNDDLTEDNWEIALEAAQRAAAEYRRGGAVLIACHQGLNRSGLVTVLTLCRLTRFKTSVHDLVDLVRQRRAGALCNEHFIEHLVQYWHKQSSRRSRGSPGAA